MHYSMRSLVACHRDTVENSEAKTICDSNTAHIVRTFAIAYIYAMIRIEVCVF